MLAGSASLLTQAPARHASSHIPLQPLDSKFAQMARVFEIASGATKVCLQSVCIHASLQAISDLTQMSNLLQSKFQFFHKTTLISS